MIALDTLSEIQRLCKFVASSKADYAGFQKKIAEIIHPGFQLVRDNGEGFLIHTDGTNYIITDNHIQSLYKIRSNDSQTRINNTIQPGKRRHK